MTSVRENRLKNSGVLQFYNDITPLLLSLTCFIFKHQPTIHHVLTVTVMFCSFIFHDHLSLLHILSSYFHYSHSHTFKCLAFFLVGQKLQNGKSAIHIQFCFSFSFLLNLFIIINLSKKAIKRARFRLIQLKNKRQSIAMQLRKDLANLILNGHEQIAIQRVCICICMVNVDVY